MKYVVGPNPDSVVIGDFNGDGTPDLAVSSPGDVPRLQGDVTILLGNGDGTFRSSSVWAELLPYSIVEADFNGDGKLDLAVITQDSLDYAFKVGVLLGNGDGTFQFHVDYAFTSQPSMLGVGDFNNDGIVDLVATDRGDGTIHVLLGVGDGSFGLDAVYITGGYPEGVVVADFNADGNADIAAATFTPGIAVLLGKGDGSFQTATFLDTGTPYGPVILTSGDFNGDGKVDLMAGFQDGVVSQNPTYRADLLLGNGDGTFQLIADVVRLTGSGWSGLSNKALSSAAFNGDHTLDLVQSALAWAGNGDGTFQSSVNLYSGHAGSVATGDLNADRAPDVVVLDIADSTINVVLNAASTEFSISASAFNPTAIGAGQSATSTVDLSLLNSFDNPVSLTCNVQPLQSGAPTCSLTPSSVMFDATGKAKATLSVSTGTAMSAIGNSASRQEPGTFLWPPLATLVFFQTGRSLSDRRRKRLLDLPLFLCLIAGLISQVSCGGGGNATKPVSYLVTIIGTSGTAQHSSTANITVQ